MAPADMTLAPHPSIPKAEGPVMVCILDGWGVNVEDQYNAVFSAETPCTDALRAVPGRYRSVKAHGTAVGLPSDADMGNSEVGHNALGSGQVVDQGARLVDIALETGKMYEGAGWKLISEAFPSNTVHFIGLLSDGGVHSRCNQLVGCIRCARCGLLARAPCCACCAGGRMLRPACMLRCCACMPRPAKRACMPSLLAACMWQQAFCTHAGGALIKLLQTNNPCKTTRGAVERGAKRIRVHIMTDGRDVPDGSSAQFVKALQEDLAALSDK